MRVMSNGRVRRSESEWRELVSRCDQAGLSAREFCRREKVELSSFFRWQRRLAGEAPRAEFVTVTKTIADPPPALAPWTLELTLPTGHKLRIQG